MIRPVRYREEEGLLMLIDQRQLPSYNEVELSDFQETAEAIETMVVRGAPAIGITAAYGLVLAMEKASDPNSAFAEAYQRLAETRPTAVNLSWALNRMRERLLSVSEDSVEGVRDALLEEANDIYKEELESEQRLGGFGAQLLEPGTNILTHCNAGGLATAGYGTALGVIRAAQDQGLNPFIWVDETRPLLQGSRLTAWELQREGISFEIIVDSAAGSLIRNGQVDVVITGADRITSAGDVANKIGTYSLAVNASRQGIPFYVAAPTSTIDLSLHSGEEIPIEERPAEEVTEINGYRPVPEGAEVYNPAFDVTPAELVDKIITEEGCFGPPYECKLSRSVEKGKGGQT